MPLFPVRYQSDARLRRLFVGLVPTSSGDNVQGRRRAVAADPARLRAGVAARRSAPSRIGSARDRSDPRARRPRRSPLRRALTRSRTAEIVAAEIEQQIEASRFVLLDFAELLVDAACRRSGAALVAGQTPSGAGRDALRPAAHQARHDDGPRDDVAHGAARRLERAAGPHGRRARTVDAARSTSTRRGSRQMRSTASSSRRCRRCARRRRRRAVDPGRHRRSRRRSRSSTPRGDDALRHPLRLPAARTARRAADVVSEPSEPFQIAGFFDLDAPARPIHISLPIDTSIKDLRKLAQERQLPALQPAARADEPRHEPQGRARRQVRRRRELRPRADLLVLDPDHHDLRAAGPDDLHQPAEHRLLVDAVPARSASRSG